MSDDDLRRALAEMRSDQRQIRADIAALSTKVDDLFGALAELSGGLAVVGSLATGNRQEVEAHKKKLRALPHLSVKRSSPIWQA